MLETFYFVPQAVCNQQWLDAVPHRRSPHQSHVATMVPETDKHIYKAQIAYFFEYIIVYIHQP